MATSPVTVPLRTLCYGQITGASPPVVQGGSGNFTVARNATGIFVVTPTGAAADAANKAGAFGIMGSANSGDGTAPIAIFLPAFSPPTITCQFYDAAGVPANPAVWTFVAWVMSYTDPLANTIP